jgi:hypothetical protein
MITSLLRVLVSLSLIAGLMIVGLNQDRDWIANFGDLGRLGYDFENLRRQRDRGEDLEVLSRATADRMGLKDKIAREVLAGRLRLRSAAARFRVLCDGVAYVWDHYKQTHPAWSEERRCCQYVIDSAAALLRDDANSDALEIIGDLTKQADECK